MTGPAEIAKRHFHLLYREQGDTLIDAVAWILQNPTDHLRWIPTLRGPQGEGKTWFVRLLESQIERQHKSVQMYDEFTHEMDHIGSISFWPSMLMDRNNQLPFFRLLCMEEFRKITSRQTEVLREIVVSDELPRHRKMIRGSPMTRVCCNVIATTCLPITSLIDGFGTFHVFKSVWARRHTPQTLIEGDAGYFKRVYDSIKDEAAISEWLMNHQISREFDHRRAPALRYA